MADVAASGVEGATWLALGFLERAVFAGARVLDVGAGDGVLGERARALGGRVVALELRSFLARKAADRGLAAVAGRAGAVRRGLFDVVVANVWPDEIVPDARDLSAALAPRGRLYVCGWPLHRAREIPQHFPWLEVVQREARGGWAGAELRHA